MSAYCPTCDRSPCICDEQRAEECNEPALTAVGSSDLVVPPPGLKLLDNLAWKIGRDDCARGLLPLRCLDYRPDKVKHYMDGYEAQMRHNKFLG